MKVLILDLLLLVLYPSFVGIPFLIPVLIIMMEG